MISVEKQAIPDPTSCNLHLFITLPNRKKSFAKHETLSICNTVTTLSNNEIICQNSNLLINFSLSSRYWYMFKLQTFVSLAYERANIFLKSTLQYSNRTIIFQPLLTIITCQSLTSNGDTCLVLNIRLKRESNGVQFVLGCCLKDPTTDFRVPVHFWMFAEVGFE